MEKVLKTHFKRAMQNELNRFAERPNPARPYQYPLIKNISD